MDKNLSASTMKVVEAISTKLSALRPPWREMEFGNGHTPYWVSSNVMGTARSHPKLTDTVFKFRVKAFTAIILYRHFFFFKEKSNLLILCNSISHQ